jgi:predicted Zn finger-like uncharacterized protein
MKITCQACQSKYTIADDKIQGKVAKIRCRKCGATVLVDASAGGGANGSGAAGAGEAWMVSVAEGDQRTMTLQEVIDAYNTGVITGDTYLWKDGMGDWLPLSEVAEIVEALNAASGDGAAAAAPVEDYSAPAEYNPPAAFQPAAPVAARRETARGRGDLFGGSAADEEVATSAPVQVTPRAASSGGGFGAASAAASAQTSSSGGLTGGRNEQSVLFSLSALTSAKAAPATPAVSSSSSGSAKHDDSGVIDLGALAKAQAAKPADAAPSPLAAPSPFLFPAALGNVETFQPQAAEQKKKSNLPLIVGGVAVVAILGVVLVMFTGKKEEIPPLPAGAALSAATAVAPEPSATAAPTPTAEASAAPADSSATGSAKAAKKATGGGGAKAKPAAAAAAAAPATPLPPPKPKSPCGCAAGDLQCQIRCSATGH